MGMFEYHKLFFKRHQFETICLYIIIFFSLMPTMMMDTFLPNHTKLPFLELSMILLSIVPGAVMVAYLTKINDMKKVWRAGLAYYFLVSFALSLEHIITRKLISINCGLAFMSVFFIIVALIFWYFDDDRCPCCDPTRGKK